MSHWILKTEPSSYSFDDLVKQQTAVWDGVKNPLALKHLAAVAKGDEVLVYHTGGERAVVGVAKVVRGAYPKDARLPVVDLQPVRALPRPVALGEMRANRKLAGFDLLRLPRLSVMPVSAEQWAAIMEMAHS